MKCSEWLRQYQITGRVPEFERERPEFAFWCGWLLGGPSKIVSGDPSDKMRPKLEMAIRAAEFIEDQR